LLVLIASFHNKTVLLHTLAVIGYLVTELHSVGSSTLHIIDVIFTERRNFLLLLGVYSGRGLDSTWDGLLLTMGTSIHCELGCIVVVRGEGGWVYGYLRGTPLLLLLLFIKSYLVLRTILNHSVLNG